jgi:hypothetical protein
MAEQPPRTEDAPDCGACAHYYITHDANFPYGCRALHFKSRRVPQQEVRDASGHPCMAFAARRKHPGSAP